jgi:hypothetical protein
MALGSGLRGRQQHERPHTPRVHDHALTLCAELCVTWGPSSMHNGLCTPAAATATLAPRCVLVVSSSRPSELHGAQHLNGSCSMGTRRNGVRVQGGCQCIGAVARLERLSRGPPPTEGARCGKARAARRGGALAAQAPEGRRAAPFREAAGRVHAPPQSLPKTASPLLPHAADARGPQKDGGVAYILQLCYGTVHGCAVGAAHTARAENCLLRPSKICLVPKSVISPPAVSPVLI